MGELALIPQNVRSTEGRADRKSEQEAKCSYRECRSSVCQCVEHSRRESEPLIIDRGGGRFCEKSKTKGMSGGGEME